MKKILIAALSFVLMVGTTACSKSQAKLDFESAVSSLEEKNQQLDSAINELQTVLDSGETPLDLSLIDTGKSLIVDAMAAKVLAPEMGKGDEAIAAQAEELNSVDYNIIISGLTDAKDQLLISIQKLKLVTNPSEEYVLTRLARVENITAIEAATEDDDPNGQLHKAGGYTSAVFFESDLVPAGTYFFDPSSTVHKGTAGGGSIEVYANAEDAKKRDTYLSAFDGGALSSGAHTVIGTVVIRISDNMKASDQQLMTERIIDALTAIE